MKALRWILFSLLAFGLGTGAAFVLHPPTIGIPPGTASRLSTDLTKIRDYAAEGRCDAVRGRLRGASAKIDALPSKTATATLNQLNDALESVRSEALSTCQRVSDAELAAQQAQDAREAEQATTPEGTPVPATEPATSPESSDESGTDGGDEVSPEQPDDGANPDDGADESVPGSSEDSGGAPLPSEDAIRQRVDKERRKWEKQAEKVQKAWEQ